MYSPSPSPLFVCIFVSLIPFVFIVENLHAHVFTLFDFFVYCFCFLVFLFCSLFSVHFHFTLAVFNWHWLYDSLNGCNYMHKYNNKGTKNTTNFIAVQNEPSWAVTKSNNPNKNLFDIWAALLTVLIEIKLCTPLLKETLLGEKCWRKL